MPISSSRALLTLLIKSPVTILTFFNVWRLFLKLFDQSCGLRANVRKLLFCFLGTLLNFFLNIFFWICFCSRLHYISFNTSEQKLEFWKLQNRVWLSWAKLLSALHTKTANAQIDAFLSYSCSDLSTRKWMCESEHLLNELQALGAHFGLNIILIFLLNA